MIFHHTAAALAAGAILFASGTAGAESFRTSYNARLTGLPVGTMAIDLTVDEKTYRIKGTTRVRGIIRIITDGKGKAEAAGRRSSDAIVPGSFSYRYAEKDDVDTMSIGFDGGRVSGVDPEPKPGGKKRIPLADADLKGAIDPLSAVLVPYDPGDAGSVCARRLPIFDGKTRYDLVLGFARTEDVRDVQGYSGPASVCSVRFVPISGHRRDGKDVKAWEKASAELWMAPLGETGTMFPLRIRVGTSWGPLVIDAERFEAI